MDNIEFFNRFTLALLEKLYSHFPNPIDIETSKLGAGLIPENSDEKVFYDLLSSTDNAVTFLEQEGFITHKGTYLEGGQFNQVRLTAKGLAVLNSTPDAIEKPLIARIRSAFAGGAKEAATETVKLLTQQAFNFAIAVPLIAHQLAR